MRLWLPVTWERQRQPNTLTIIEMCCSLIFVLLYSEFIELATINRYKTVSIRVSRIEPDPYMMKVITFFGKVWETHFRRKINNYFRSTKIFSLKGKDSNLKVSWGLFITNVQKYWIFKNLLLFWLKRYNFQFFVFNLNLLIYTKQLNNSFCNWTSSKRQMEQIDPKSLS